MLAVCRRPQTKLLIFERKGLKKKKNVVNKFYVLAIYQEKRLFYSGWFLGDAANMFVDSVLREMPAVF